MLSRSAWWWWRLANIPCPGCWFPLPCRFAVCHLRLELRLAADCLVKRAGQWWPNLLSLQDGYSISFHLFLSFSVFDEELLEELEGFSFSFSSHQLSVVSRMNFGDVVPGGGRDRAETRRVIFFYKALPPRAFPALTQYLRAVI